MVSLLHGVWAIPSMQLEKSSQSKTAAFEWQADSTAEERTPHGAEVRFHIPMCVCKLTDDISEDVVLCDTRACASRQV